MAAYLVKTTYPSGGYDARELNTETHHIDTELTDLNRWEQAEMVTFFEIIDGEPSDEWAMRAPEGLFHKMEGNW